MADATNAEAGSGDHAAESIYTHGVMKTKAGKVLSAEEWDASLERLMYKPPRMPVELYCKFVQVPTAQLDEDELKKSSERLSRAYNREKDAEEPVKPMWLKFDIDAKGRTVPKFAPWKKTTPDAQLQHCRSMCDRGLQHDRAREEALLSKWCKPLTHHDPVDPAHALAHYQKRLIGVYGRSGSALGTGQKVTGQRAARRVNPGPTADAAAAEDA